MRTGNRYSAYRGRGGVRTFLKVLIAALLAVLLLMLVGFFLLEKYMVYGPDGARLVLPFMTREAQEEPPLEGDTVLVVESAPPTPEPTAEPGYLRAVHLPRTALTDGTAATQVQVLGGNAALFDMKADDGTLGYVSSLPLAISVASSSAEPGRNAAITAVTGGDLYTVARVSCFRDNLAPYQQNKLAIKTNSGYNWRDQGEIRWTSPTNADARQYIADVCAELAGLGFDEILLDWAGYPTTGNLGYIKKGDAYNQDQFSTVVAGFYSQIKLALSAYPQIKLSIVTTESALSGGGDPLSGQTVTGLVQFADRIWTPLSDSGRTQCIDVLSRAGLAETERNLVSMATLPGSEDQSWAIVNLW